jgi:hypothetical protein
MLCACWDTGQDLLDNYAMSERIVPSGNFKSDVWQQVRIEWNCSAATYKAWVNGTYRGEFSFWNSGGTATAIDCLEFTTSNTYTAGNFYCYVEDVDYSWVGKYYGTGMWRSNITTLDILAPYYETIGICYVNNANTSIQMSYRMSSDNSTWVHYNGSTWDEGWSAWTTTNISLNVYGRRYFQVRIWLSTTDPFQTPILYTISTKLYYF